LHAEALQLAGWVERQLRPRRAQMMAKTRLQLLDGHVEHHGLSVIGGRQHQTMYERAAGPVPAEQRAVPC
jgi:hypothetical protein